MLQPFAVEFRISAPSACTYRFAKNYNVFYFEEPHTGPDSYEIIKQDGISVVIIHIENHHDDYKGRMTLIMDRFLKDQHIQDYLCWYYTPMALEYTAHLTPKVTVYDLMDELSAFRFALPQLLELEEELFKKADVVFTGGHTLYQAKKDRHHNIHPFPSSIDKEHFRQARRKTTDSSDQQHIPHPRFGFFGVIDERFDIELLKEVSARKPDWHFVIIGPVVKIDPAELPKAENIHFFRS